MDKNEPETGETPGLEDGRGSFSDETDIGEHAEAAGQDERPPPPPPGAQLAPPDPPAVPTDETVAPVELGQGSPASSTLPASSTPTSSSLPATASAASIDAGRTQSGETGLIDLGEAIADERDRDRPASWKYALALGLPVIVAIGLIALLASRGTDEPDDFTLGESTEIASGADADIPEAEDQAQPDTEADEGTVGILSDAEPVEPDDSAPVDTAADAEAALEDPASPDPASTTDDPQPALLDLDSDREPEDRADETENADATDNTDATDSAPDEAVTDEPDLQPTEAPEPEPEPETTEDDDGSAAAATDDPEEDRATSTVRAITNIDGFAALYAESSPQGDPYDAYKRVTDDTEAFSVSVPTAFTFINGAPDANGVKLIAARAEGTALSQPSVTIEVFPEGSVDEILAENGPAFLAECTVLTYGYELATEAAYEGLLFADEIQSDDGANGAYIYYESCQFEPDSAIIQVVLRNPDGKVARVQAFVLTSAELEMLDQVIASLDF